MKTNEIRFGGLMLVCFIAFFFIMKSFGLYTKLELRGLNVIIHVTFAFLAMRSFRKGNPGVLKYLETFAVGFRTSIIGVVGFSIFQFFYLAVINPDFMTYVHETAILGDYLTPLNTSVFLVIEGLAVTFFASYLGMRYLTVVENVPSISQTQRS